jgi:hypothetical protein
VSEPHVDVVSIFTQGFVSVDPKYRIKNLEGGFVYGREQVHDYWEKQFKVVQPQR